jgi:O-antigen/teichoic acid export membrane protein
MASTRRGTPRPAARAPAAGREAPGDDVPPERASAPGPEAAGVDLPPERASRADHLALVASQFASGAGSLALLLVTARTLGPSGRGVFAFFLLWPALGGYLLSLGLPGANLKFAAERPERAAGLFGNGLAVSVGIGALVAVVLAAGPADWLVGPMPSTVTWLAGLTLAVTVAFNAITWTQMGLGDYVGPNLLKGAVPLVAAAVLLALDAAGVGDGSVTAAAAVYAACVLAATGIAGAALARRGGPPALDLPLLRVTLAFAVRFQGILVAQTVSFRADQWVLGASHGPAALGVYSLAVSVSEVATYLASARGMTVFRSAARGTSGSARRLVAEVVAVTAASAALVAAIGVWAIPLVFGEGFRDAVGLLALLLPGTVGLGLLRVCGNELSGRGRPGVVAVVAIAQAVGLLGAFLLLVPDGGGRAAAIVSSAGYLLGGAACAWLAASGARRG